MKSHMVAIAVLAAGAVSAEEVLKCDRNAQVKFCDAGLVVQPSGFLPGWASVDCVGDRGVAGEDVVPFRMDGRT